MGAELPVLNRNQGPIAEAKARREEVAAKFNALQAKVLAEIERAVEAFRISEKNSVALEALAREQARQRESIAAQFRAGAVDRVDLLNAQIEAIGSSLLEVDGQLKLRQAEAQLEDAIQRPIATIQSSVIEQRPLSAKEIQP